MAKPILYGVSDFVNVIQRDGYYLDRTGLIPELEKTDFAMFLRPRRFGKSLLLSMLQCYYDIYYASRFEELFSKLNIGKNPTAEHGKYLVLTFNFSGVDKQLDRVQESFNFYAGLCIDTFVEKYRSFLPADLESLVKNCPSANGKLSLLAEKLKYSETTKIYIMIDEYDNFTNTILAEHGLDAYNSLCHGEGFFKQFFNTLKLATTSSDSPVKRLFITGVSPVTMDDVTSGFNIAKNISVQNEFCELLGFNHQELQDILDYYQAEGEFRLDKDKALTTMLEWYDNYNFTLEADNKVANTTLVLNYVKECLRGQFPQKLWDENLRSDYAKLRFLVTLNRRLNGNFHVIETLLNDGTICDTLIESFNAQELIKSKNFISLLYYFGMTAIAGDDFGSTVFKIPNKTIRHFLQEFVTSGYEDVYKIDDSVWELSREVRHFAKTGDWQPMLANLAKTIKEYWRVRDGIEGERVVQTAMGVLLGLAAGPFIVDHELEAGGGYLDLAMAPDLGRYPQLQQALLLELKYIKKDESPEALADTIVAQAQTQLNQYVTDHNLQKAWQIDNGVSLHKLVVIFHGGEMEMCREIN